MAGQRKFRTLGLYGVAWIEHFLVHGPGDVQGKRIELDDELAQFTLKAYELDARGNRRIRRAFLSRAKGRNKSGFAAMLECFEALGECRFDHWAEPGEVSDWGYTFEPGEPVGKRLAYAEIINVATEEGQAGNTYDAVYYMLHPDTCSSDLFERFGRIDVGLTRINLPDWRGFIEPVSSSNESNDGGKSTFIIADETHLWVPPVTGAFKLGKMHQTMLRNLLKRNEASGWMLETSTMYAEGERSVAQGTHATAMSKAYSTLLFDHRQASDHWDLGKRSERLDALREAYGPAAAWMNLSAIADYWDDPQATEAEFRRFWLNQPVPLLNPVAIDVVRWTDLENFDAVPPARVALVVNVSPYRSAATIAVAGDGAEGKTLVMVFTGDGTGWVAEKVAELVAARDIAEVALTPGEARGLESELVREGILEVKRLTGTDVAASCSAFLAAITDGTVEHVGDRMLGRAVGEARLRRMGASETWDVDQKVDVSPLVAAAAAFHRWGMQEKPVVYDVLQSVW